MAGIHSDLEQLHTSYNAFGDQNNDEDDDSPPQFHQSNWYGATYSTNIPMANQPKTQYHEPQIGNDGVIIHTVAEENKSRWSHIEDLDSFFKNIYTYHQKHGFRVMLVQVSDTFIRSDVNL